MKEASEHRNMIVASVRSRSSPALVSDLFIQIPELYQMGFSLGTIHTVFYRGHWLKVCTQITEPA